MSKTCFLCGKSERNVNIFTNQTLIKCSECLVVRKKWNLQYKDVIIPENENSAVGYHSKCYSNFTAVKKKYAGDDDPIPSTSSSRKLRSQSTTPACTTTRTGILPRECIFCGKNRKVVKRKAQKLIAVATKTFESTIREEANKLRDYEFLKKFDVDFVAKEVHYHSICRLAYRKKVDSTLKSSETQPIKSSEYLNQALQSVFHFVDETIIKKKEVYYLTFLHKILINSFHELSEGLECSYTAQKLEAKLKKQFSDVQITVSGNQKIVHSSTILGHQLKALISKDEIILKEAAYILRNTIRQIKPQKLPQQPSLNDIKKGEVDVPENLLNFLTDVIGGSDPRVRQSDPTRIRSNSVAQDIIFACSSGKLKPQKHLLLGFSLKSLTGSRNIVNIMNKYGHCLSYTLIEEIETELCYTEASTPLGLSSSNFILSPELATGVAFDNFDRYVETLTGKDTLHDTVGIVYQNYHPLEDNPISVLPESGEVGTSEKGVRRRRMYQPEDKPLEPYRRKPKMVGTLLSLNPSPVPPLTLRVSNTKDFCWLLSWVLEIPDTPMWIGFNAGLTIDRSPIQRIFYLPPINESPTSATVVQETMNRALAIASEVGQTNILVTYDLALTKVALQIQSTESPKFDRLFIQVGDFHLMMAYFKAIGKFIEECGLPYILIESGVLAGGSLNGFLDGKHFNRCKRLHPLISLTLQRLHFERFLKDENIDISDEFKDEINSLCPATESVFMQSAELSDLYDKYQSYKEKTLNGNYGKTAQFYSIYIQLVQHYLLLSRAVREGDHDLYKYILPFINNLFFTFNQPNYARWLVKYSDNLAKVATTHPDLKSVFQSGCFGVRRSNNHFSRLPVDLTLEQTVNADAAKKLTGISHFTNSISARQRWARNQSTRAEIVSLMYEQLGMKKSEDVSNETRPHRIVKDRKAVTLLDTTVKRHINPFDLALNKDSLYNIATGREADESISNFLLCVESIGKSAREQFIEACTENPLRFESPIKRTKLFTFVNQQKKTIPKKNENLSEALMCRDIFGRMLALSFQYKIDIGEVLSYPLTPTPRALCHIDGTLLKTDKSTLLKNLEQRIMHDPPPSIDVVIVDGFFLIHTMGEFPRTYGMISRKLLSMLNHYKAEYVHIVFDQYFKPSLKDCERQRRATMASTPTYTIIGADQVRPSQFIEALRSDDFKEKLVKFFVSHWKEQEQHHFFKDRTIFITEGNECYSYRASEDSFDCNMEPNFYCEHEEADTRMIFHLSKMPAPMNVVFRTNDTDVLIAILANLEKLEFCHQVWMEVGLFSNNTQRYIHVTQLFEHLGEKMCQALPAYHCFTGSDYTAAFFRKGKITPLKIVEKNEEYLDFFARLHSEGLTEENERTAEQFVCLMYGIKGCNSVNQARVIMFEKSYKPRKLQETLVKVCKKFEARSIPPCFSTLREKLKRCVLTASTLHRACETVALTLAPTEYGWVEDDGYYSPKWYDGDMAPSLTMSILQERDTTDTEDEDETNFDDGSSEEESDDNEE